MLFNQAQAFIKFPISFIELMGINFIFEFAWQIVVYWKFHF